MFALYNVVALAFAAGALANPLVQRQAETHTVTLVNNCPAGSSAVFLYQDNATPQGSTTITGPLKGGVAWVSNFPGVDCQSSGVNCDTVEFTLINPGDDAGNSQNAVNYSLQGNGNTLPANHNFVYPMSFSVSGCSLAPALGACTSNDNCPGAFTGADATDGLVSQCSGSNVGITITFC